ncbi:MAG: hypothetical protein IPL77_16475 [Flavobacteriales bacterium]|nr:hypothetical protein [Flavobacteriales bacterium]
MRKLGKPQWLALAGAVVVVVLLMLLPRTPKTGENAKAAEVSPLRVKLDEAIALVNGTQPMQGIMILRQLAEEHPEEAEVHWHLGLFSLQSGQVDKAVGRFRQVVELDQEGKFPEAWSLLGQSYAMMDSTTAAITAFETYRTRTTDAEALQATDRALEGLRNKLEEQEHALR